MVKARVKITAKPTKKGSGTLIARAPVAVTHTDRPKGTAIYQTKAQLNIHLNRGKRPKTIKRK